MHYRVHRWLAVHVIKHMVSVNWSLGARGEVGEYFPQKMACHSFGSHGNGTLQS